MLGKDYPKGMSGYQNNIDRAERLEKLIGEKELRTAYFNNNPNILERAIDNQLGKGYWKKYSEACDNYLNPQLDKRTRQWYNKSADKILDLLEKRLEGSRK